MSHPSEASPAQLADDYLGGVRTAYETVDRWIDAALAPDFRSIQEDWEDVRQEVRVRLYRNLARGHFDGRSSLRTYVHRMTRNVAIDFTRQAHRRRETGGVEDLPSRLAIQPGSGPENIDNRDLLEKILEPFSAEDRLMVALVFEERCSVDEVAARLGIPAGTVKSRVSRLREKILQRRGRLCARGPDAR